MTPGADAQARPTRPEPTAPSDRRRGRVVIADADGLARRMVRDALEAAAQVTPVAYAATGREAVELSRYYTARVLLVDAAVPPDGGVELTRAVAQQLPDTAVLFLTAGTDDELALEALQAGAAGYANKDLDPAALAHIVARMADGEAAVPRRLVMRLLKRLQGVPDAGWRPVRSRLTTREWEIVDLLATGDTTQQMADRLVLSPATVYSHVKSLMRKLGVHTRHDAVPVAEQLRHEEALGRNVLGGLR
jgi:DNA-binding NarL/FixJ family response regulator